MKRFKLDVAAFMLDAGDTANISTNNASEGCIIKWTSDNEPVARVNERGCVTGMANGDAVIRCELFEPGAAMANASAECRVTVGYAGQNPIIPPSWGLFIADGEPHVFDDILYVYGSRDCPEGDMPGAPKRDWCSDSYHVIWSCDGIHWTDAGEALHVSDIPECIRGEGTRLWAPDLYKSPADGMYHLLFCTNGANIFTAEAINPTGPFENIKRITLGDDEIRTIDPAALTDDRRVYIALPGEFLIAQLDPLDESRALKDTRVCLRSLIEESNPEYFPFEGPSLRKRGDTYYYVYIASRKGENVPTRMNYLYTKTPMIQSSWRFGGTIIDTRDFLRAGNVHGSFCEFKGRWLLSYHRMAPGYARFTRTMNLDVLEFDSSGRILPVTRTSSGLTGAFPMGIMIYAFSACQFSGGREDDRFIQGGGPYGGAMLRLTREWAAYRYALIGEGVKKFCLNYRCAREARVKCALHDISGREEWSIIFDLPASNLGEAVRRPISPPAGKWEVRLMLYEPIDVDFELAQFCFE